MIINTSSFKDGDTVIMAGMISGVRTMITRKSQEMARLTLEDFDGVIDAIVFPKVYERKRNLVSNDMIVGVLGRVSFNDESEAEILVEDIVPIENIASLGRGRANGGRGQDGYGYQYGEAPAPMPKRTERPAPAPLNDPVKLRVNGELLASHGSPRRLLMHLTDMFSLYPGDRDVLVYLPGQKPVRCNADKRITLTDDLRAKLVRLFGAENVKG
jgi:DNA polymerase-3 subunit alpha